MYLLEKISITHRGKPTKMKLIWLLPKTIALFVK
jgi:hypothetical protein